MYVTANDVYKQKYVILFKFHGDLEHAQKVVLTSVGHHCYKNKRRVTRRVVAGKN